MINFESVINYYQYVYNIRGIHTVATGLESTSVIFAYGLGMMTKIIRTTDLSSIYCIDTSLCLGLFIFLE